MPALSFQGAWLDPVLRSDKEQSTRPQTDRFEVGDVCHIYNQQRGRIKDKPLRKLTALGFSVVDGRRRTDDYSGNTYPHPPRYYIDGIKMVDYDYAHFLGKVEITKVYLFVPVEMATFELQNWAQADGFKNFHPTNQIFTKGIHEGDGANMWFQRRYGDNWMHKTWTVIQWHGWMERYFEPRTQQ